MSHLPRVWIVETLLTALPRVQDIIVIQLNDSGVGAAGSQTVVDTRRAAKGKGTVYLWLLSQFIRAYIQETRLFFYC